MKKLENNTINKIKISLAQVERDISERIKKYGSFNSAKYCMDDSVVCLSWDDDEAKERLLMSRYNDDFFRLANMYQPQKNPFFCGVAAMVMVLNAMRAGTGKIPSQEGLNFDLMQEDGSIRHIPYQLYSQKTFLNESTDQVKNKDKIWPKNYDENASQDFDPGLEIEHVEKILKIYEANARLIFADDEIDIGIPRFRDHVKNNLVDGKKFIIVNYDGKAVGADVGGHFSPIAAYHERTDSVLVLDPAAHKNPWYWLPLPHLYFAMHTRDSDSYRGYILISDD